MAIRKFYECNLCGFKGSVSEFQKHVKEIHSDIDFNKFFCDYLNLSYPQLCKGGCGKEINVAYRTSHPTAGFYFPSHCSRYCLQHDPEIKFKKSKKLKGKSAWNKGLTKGTSENVAKYANSLSITKCRQRAETLPSSQSELEMVRILKEDLKLDVDTQRPIFLPKFKCKRYLDSYFKIGLFKFNIEIDGDHCHNVNLDMYKDMNIYKDCDILTIRINNEISKTLKFYDYVDIIIWHILHGPYFKIFNTTRKIYDYKWLLGDLKLITWQH